MHSSWMPKTAGLLNIIAGSIGILGSLIAALLVNVMNSFQDYPGTFENVLGDQAVWFVLILFFLINTTAIIGGVLAIKRKRWGFALAGAISSILSLWGWILGIASIVLLILSKSEFEKKLYEN